jgi:hypothetical protein
MPARRDRIRSSKSTAAGGKQTSYPTRSGGRAIGETLPARDQHPPGVTLKVSHTLALLSALEIASASLSVIVRSNLENPRRDKP